MWEVNTSRQGSLGPYWRPAATWGLFGHLTYIISNPYNIAISWSYYPYCMDEEISLKRLCVFPKSRKFQMTNTTFMGEAPNSHEEGRGLGSWGWLEFWLDHSRGETLLSQPNLSPPLKKKAPALYYNTQHHYFKHLPFLYPNPKQRPHLYKDMNLSKLKVVHLRRCIFF